MMINDDDDDDDDQGGFQCSWSDYDQWECKYKQ